MFSLGHSNEKLEASAELLGLSRRQYRRKLSAERLARMVNGSTFNIIIAILILISVVLLFFEFFLPPSITTQRVHIASNLLTQIFILELSLRFYVAPNKRIFFANYWIDILSVLPILRIFRTFRLLRVLRLLRLTRVILIMLRHSGWLSRNVEGNILRFGALVMTSIMLVLSVSLALISLDYGSQTEMIHIEDFLLKLWETSFLFVSGEMVGDTPPTILGRILSLGITVAGLVVFAVFVGTVSASMTTYFSKRMDTKDLKLADLKGHVIICGWDRMGGVILQELESVPDLWQHGVVVVADLQDGEQIDNYVKNARRLFHLNDDFTKIEILEEAGAAKAKTAIVLADKGDNLKDQDRDARTVLAALTLEKINPQIFTCAELLDDRNAEHLRIAGVEEIISRTNLTAGLFASTAINTGIARVVKDILTHQHGNYMKKLLVPDNFKGKTYLEAMSYFKERYDATIIAIERSIEEMPQIEQIVNPSADEVFREDDRLVLIFKQNSKIIGV